MFDIMQVFILQRIDGDRAAPVEALMESNGNENAPRVPLIMATLFAIIAAGAVTDVILDDPESWFGPHILLEIGLITVSLGATVWLGWNWYRSLRSVDRLGRLLEERKEERDRWKSSAQRLLEGLGRAIDAQFETWSLTPAERETAVMMLKGFSHKRIAKLTDRSDRTVRQHAVAVYRKSGLAGRSELAAFFLADLPLPGIDAANPAENEVGGEAET
jgi:DNA-binding CsgD family transcriptional regulator